MNARSRKLLSTVILPVECAIFATQCMLSNILEIY